MCESVLCMKCNTFNKHLKVETFSAILDTTVYYYLIKHFIYFFLEILCQFRDLCMLFACCLCNFELYQTNIAKNYILQLTIAKEHSNNLK